MKKILVLIATTLLFGCPQQEPSYFDSNYEKVMAAAKQQNKPVFIDFYTQWCGPCKLFEKEMVNDSVFQYYITNNFISAKIDAELKENIEIATQYGITGYPTFIITDSNGEEIDRIVGLQAENAQEFIATLKRIIEGKEDITLLKQHYYQHPDSLDLFRTLVRNKLIAQDFYEQALEVSKFAEQNSSNNELKIEAQLYYAYAMIRKQNPSPTEMRRFVKNDEITMQFKQWGYNELYQYYRAENNTDSVDYYLDILIKSDFSNNLGYVRDYADFLYKQNKDIEKADSLTKYYSDYGENYADHWTPYLNAHSLARHGKIEQGIAIFDKWMAEYSKPENFSEDIWHYYFYIDFTNFYNAPSPNAVKYAKIIEDNNPTVHNKKILAKVYLINGMQPQAIDKLTEAKSLYEDPNKKAEIDKLIQEAKDTTH